jgi:hypothetical protein
VNINFWFRRKPFWRWIFQSRVYWIAGWRGWRRLLDSRDCGSMNGIIDGVLVGKLKVDWKFWLLEVWSWIETWDSIEGFEKNWQKLIQQKFDCSIVRLFFWNCGAIENLEVFYVNSWTTFFHKSDHALHFMITISRTMMVPWRKLQRNWQRIAFILAVIFKWLYCIAQNLLHYFATWQSSKSLGWMLQTINRLNCGFQSKTVLNFLSHSSQINSHESESSKKLAKITWNLKNFHQTCSQCSKIILLKRLFIQLLKISAIAFQIKQYSSYDSRWT